MTHDAIFESGVALHSLCCPGHNAQKMSAITYERYTNPANGQQTTRAASFEPSPAAVQAVAAARELLESRPDRDLAGFLAAAGDSIGSTVFGHCVVGVPGGASLMGPSSAYLDVASALDPLLASPPARCERVSKSSAGYVITRPGPQCAIAQSG